MDSHQATQTLDADQAELAENTGDNAKTAGVSKGSTPHTSDDAASALAILRHIRDASSSSTTEKINAIRSISALLGRSEEDGRGPGMMTREEIASELDRLKTLTQS
jgi:hypothetical protein